MIMEFKRCFCDIKEAKLHGLEGGGGVLLNFERGSRLLLFLFEHRK